MTVTVHAEGDLSKTKEFLADCEKFDARTILSRYGEQGVSALRAATPVRTGLTASSWTYRIESAPGTVSLIWENTNLNKGKSIALLLRYGHGTRNGGYVRGYDYLTPALKPIFDRISEEAWNEVTHNA